MCHYLGAEAVSVMAETRVRTSAAANPVDPMQDANANISAAERCSAASAASAATMSTLSARLLARAATSSRLPTSPATGAQKISLKYSETWFKAN